jgi:hypothetical protein
VHGHRNPPESKAASVGGLFHFTVSVSQPSQPRGGGTAEQDRLFTNLFVQLLRPIQMLIKG